MSKSDLFTKVPIQKIPRNRFDLSHEVKMSGKFGFLYPILLMETLPGDTIVDRMTAMLRFAPMLAPVMHRIDVKTDFFFVPSRLLAGQETWETFITGGQDGMQEVVLPYCTPQGIATAGSVARMTKGTLWDYFGLPLGDGVTTTGLSTQHISALPFRAYVKIMQDYFRDPNLSADYEFPTDVQGDVSPEIATVLLQAPYLRGWERDYFTGSLPWAQRGAEVLMPLSGTGSVEWSSDVTEQVWESLAGSPGIASGNTQINLLRNLTDSGGLAIKPGPDAATVDIDGTTTINDFRRSLAIQRWLENNARAGGRYIEQIQSHYGVRVPDYRLQRAEYLGGGRQPVQISEVLSTADTTSVPVGDMAGHGISVGKTNRFRYYCQEHGYIIGILSVVPKPAYASQGIAKMWTKDSRYDIGFPEFANLGEQEVLSKELYYSMLAADDDENNEVFGYVPRFAEYKWMGDRVAGDFRDDLAFWHLSRIFTDRPALDNTFLEMTEDGAGSNEESYRRIFAVQDGTDYLWMQLYHDLSAKRPLPYFGVPKILG